LPGTSLHTNTMSKLRLSVGLGLLLSLVVTAPAVWPQEVQHAPTVEQCRADQRLWLSELEGPPGPPASIGSIGYPELLKRSDEMYACRAVDPDFEHQYYNVMGEIAFARVVRLDGSSFTKEEAEEPLHACTNCISATQSTKSSRRKAATWSASEINACLSPYPTTPNLAFSCLPAHVVHNNALVRWIRRH